MANKDLREVRQIYAALRELVIEKRGGGEDPAALLEALRLCRAGIAALDDAECRERLRTVEAQASELFSRDAHLKWRRSSMSGADYLRLQMLIALEALNTRLFLLEALRGKADSGMSPAEAGHAPEAGLAAPQGGD